MQSETQRPHAVGRNFISIGGVENHVRALLSHLLAAAVPYAWIRGFIRHEAAGLETFALE
jgi:hypothetical protein